MVVGSGCASGEAGGKGVVDTLGLARSMNASLEEHHGEGPGERPGGIDDRKGSRIA
jgi:hypothetical protein